MARLALSIGASAEAVGAAQAALAGFLAAQGLPPRTVAQAELLLEEVALNALRHGSAASVELAATADPPRCLLVFEDRGRPFDPTTAPLPPRGAGGHGLRLLRAIAYRLAYGRTPDGVNRLEVTLTPE